MEIEVQSKEENRLLHRLEVRFVLTYPEGPTPPRDTVRSELAKVLKAANQPLVIDHVRTEFGKREARGYAKVYDSLEDAARVERKHVLRRNGLLQEGGASTATPTEPPPSAPPPEAPPEGAEETPEAPEEKTEEG